MRVQFSCPSNRPKSYAKMELLFMVLKLPENGSDLEIVWPSEWCAAFDLC